MSRRSSAREAHGGGQGGVVGEQRRGGGGDAARGAGRAGGELHDGGDRRHRWHGEDRGGRLCCLARPVVSRHANGPALRSRGPAWAAQEGRGAQGGEDAQGLRRRASGRRAAGRRVRPGAGRAARRGSPGRWRRRARRSHPGRPARIASLRPAGARRRAPGRRRRPTVARRSGETTSGARGSRRTSRSKAWRIGSGELKTAARLLPRVRSGDDTRGGSAASGRRCRTPLRTW